jgi:hypothetical protein
VVTAVRTYKGYGSAASVFICSGRVSDIYHHGRSAMEANEANASLLKRQV